MAITQNKDKGKAQLKKYAVLTVMFIAFGVSMWFIFAPSKEDRDKQAQSSGYNSELPDPKKAGIVGDKKEAYEQEQSRVRQQEKMQSLQDFSLQLSGKNPGTEDRNDQEQQLQMASKPTEYGSASYQQTDAYKRQNSIEASSSAYQDINKTLGNFYEQPKDDPEKEALKAQLSELQARLQEKQEHQNTIDEQLMLMEKSYELAAKYTTPPPVPQVAETESSSSRKPKAVPVSQVPKQTVSALFQPVSDAEFARRYAVERNLGFATSIEESAPAGANTIMAVVHGDQTVIDGQSVCLRLTEPMSVDGVVLPPATLLTGFARIQGERLEILVSSVEYGGRVVPVSLTAYDTDGQPGIHIPRSMELSAAKEIAANAGANLGSSINITQQSAGEQLLTDLGRGVIQGTSSYLSKKIRQVKVTLKAGYRVLLLPSEN